MPKQNDNIGKGSTMAQPDIKKPSEASEEDISAPRLTPQGRTGPDEAGEDSTDPMGKGAKKGQGDKAEG